MPEISDPYRETNEVIQQEPWDYDVFVAEYNKAAGTNFHHYVEDSITEHLQRFYEEETEDFPTIKKFAISQLESEQVYTDDVLTKYRD